MARTTSKGAKVLSKAFTASRAATPALRRTASRKVYSPQAKAAIRKLTSAQPMKKIQKVGVMPRLSTSSRATPVMKKAYKALTKRK